jgi:anthranilate phosphoribosyltransferase
MMTEVLQKLVVREDLSTEECIAVLYEIFHSAEPSQTAAFLALLRSKGETASEFLAIIRELQKTRVKLPVSRDAIDIVGTGGDGKKSVNISTAAAILTASCGMKVVKHGGSSVSSKSGAADVLEALGINIRISPEKAATSLERAGICFCFAPLYHPAFAKVRDVRKGLKIPTSFNLIAPLLNPANVHFLLFGVYQEKLLKIMAEVLFQMGVKRAWVVHCEGYDELTTLSECKGFEVTANGTKPFTIDPQELGFSQGDESDLLGGSPEENAQRIVEVFSGKEGTLADTIVLNAAAALKICGKVSDLKEGITLARSAIQKGRALETLAKWREECSLRS